MLWVSLVGAGPWGGAHRSPGARARGVLVSPPWSQFLQALGYPRDAGQGRPRAGLRGECVGRLPPRLAGPLVTVPH